MHEQGVGIDELLTAFKGESGEVDKASFVANAVVLMTAAGGVDPTAVADELGAMYEQMMVRRPPRGRPPPAIHLGRVPATSRLPQSRARHVCRWSVLAAAAARLPCPLNRSARRRSRMPLLPSPAARTGLREHGSEAPASSRRRCIGREGGRGRTH